MSDECKIDGIAQAWSVLSGAAPRHHAERAMDAVRAHLLRRGPRLLLLLSPPFDTSAQDLWNARKPLVRRIETAPGECVMMAIDPWQADDDNHTAQVTCGGRAYAVPMRGKHTTLIELRPSGAIEY